MIITALLILLLGSALIALGVILYKRLPQILVLDPSSSKAAKARELKQDILRKRLERVTAVPLSTAKDVASAPFRMAQTFVRTMAGKLTALERKYKEKAKGAGVIDDADTRRILEGAERALRGGDTDSAEKMLIELISLNPKHVEAYELLGRVYTATKDYTLARETFTHVLKLAPKDASIHANLGEVYALENENKKSLESFRKAKDLSPNNPKYLDFFISAAVKAGNLLEAKEALDHLKEVNPENQKIPEFTAILQ